MSATPMDLSCRPPELLPEEHWSVFGNEDVPRTGLPVTFEPAG